MSDKTYCQRNKEVILNRAKDCYERNKEKLLKKQEINTENNQKIKKYKERIWKK